MEKQFGFNNDRVCYIINEAEMVAESPEELLIAGANIVLLALTEEEQGVESIPTAPGEAEMLQDLRKKLKTYLTT